MVDRRRLADGDKKRRRNKKRLRSHFGSSHFLFERALCFSCVTSFSGFVLSKCLQPSFVASHLFSWRVLTMGLKCLSLLNLVHLRIMVLLTVPVLISTEWAPAHLIHSSKSSEVCCYHSRVDLQSSTNESRRGYCHLQNYPCSADRQCPLCQGGFVCSNGTERQHPYIKCQLSDCAYMPD